MTVATWDEMIAVNLRSVFLCTRTVLPGMIERRWGRIVSTSSQLAHKSGRQLTHYAAAKADVLGSTRSLAYEVAQSSIRAIQHYSQRDLPGTNQHRHVIGRFGGMKAQKLSELPLGRHGEAEEVAPTAVLIASDEDTYYTGASFNMNGGRDGLTMVTASVRLRGRSPARLSVPHERWESKWNRQYRQHNRNN
jgi:3-oxoacyl-[acyl-carrier protein] reductase